MSWEESKFKYWKIRLNIILRFILVSLEVSNTFGQNCITKSLEKFQSWYQFLYLLVHQSFKMFQVLTYFSTCKIGNFAKLLHFPTPNIVGSNVFIKLLLISCYALIALTIQKVSESCKRRIKISQTKWNWLALYSKLDF